MVTKEVYVGYASSAGAFFLSPVRSLHNLDSLRDLRDVVSAEEDLADLADRGELRPPGSTTEKYDLLAVRAGGSWRRGMALEAESGRRLSKVLMVDTGDLVRDVSIREDVRILPERTRKPPKLAYKFRLSGISPPPPTETETKTNDWSRPATVMVRRLLTVAEAVVAVRSSGGPGGGGDLVVQLTSPDDRGSGRDQRKVTRRYRHILRGRTLLSLSEVLVEAGYAAEVASDQRQSGPAAAGAGAGAGGGVCLRTASSGSLDTASSVCSPLVDEAIEGNLESVCGGSLRERGGHRIAEKESKHATTPPPPPPPEYTRYSTRETTFPTPITSYRNKTHHIGSTARICHKDQKFLL